MREKEMRGRARDTWWSKRIQGCVNVKKRDI